MGSSNHLVARILPNTVEAFAFKRLSNEARQKLILARPATLGQASRLEGMTPSAVSQRIKALEERDWQLSEILLTHHHGDHIDGVSAIREEHFCRVVGAAAVGLPQGVPGGVVALALGPQRIPLNPQGVGAKRVGPAAIPVRVDEHRHPIVRPHTWCYLQPGL